ncbi:leucine-rich repeat domain-containing protein [Leucobacter chromiireducens subsp. chromiireducens]|uniref:Leucine-rich repeat domain-containing protein n=3 Tax=Leucobacter TaxID=55968 RepID=A0ABS1SNR7_9MICO|nr:leucine-rich repeat domain-containing protein [Leucobacter chromiireducens subsp. chromiireducens]
MGLRRIGFERISSPALRHGAVVVIGALVAGAAFAMGAVMPTAAQALAADLVDIPLGADTGLGTTTPNEANVEQQPAQPLETRQARALPDDRERVEIPDPILRREIARKLNLSQSSTITRGDVRRLQSLTAKNLGITDLTGLEFATSLSNLYVDQNGITSLEPLRDLPSMRQLTASRNPISDISPLATLPNINWLELNWTEITSLEALRGNIKLGWLQVAYTGIDSIEPLNESTNIGSLYIQNTTVSDLAPLAGIEGIQVISAPNAEISDLEPLRGKEKLFLLNINSNHVTDLSMLETWPSISTVGFNDQEIDGGNALIPAGANEFTRSDIVPMFKMPFDERQQVVEHAAPTEDGDGAVWSDMEADADRIEVFLSKPVVPGGPPFSATVEFAVERAEFMNAEPHEAALDTPYEFSFEATSGFVVNEVTRGTGTSGYSMLQGSVPGLQLSADGVLSGTPTSRGSFDFTVRAADRHGNVLDRSYAIAVGEKPVTPEPPTVVPPTTEPPVVVPPKVDPPAVDPGVTPQTKEDAKGADTHVLAHTGAAAQWSLALAALLLCGAGIFLALRAKLRRR